NGLQERQNASQVPPSSGCAQADGGTVVRHPRYGLCTVGDYDREQRRISLHAYRTNTGLTQQAKPEECRRLTTLAFRSWLIAEQEGTVYLGAGGEAPPMERHQRVCSGRTDVRQPQP